jgi:aryl-alcohol dehydrogenase-like predicted oxidoreductase
MESTRADCRVQRPGVGGRRALPSADDAPCAPGHEQRSRNDGLVVVQRHGYCLDMRMTQSSHPTLASGSADRDGVQRYRKRMAARFASDYFRPLAGPLVASSIGIGTYLGDCSETDDARYTRTVRHALRSGINLVDSAINYRCQRSERAVGAAIREALAAGEVERDEIVVCTKGGYLPLDGTPPASRAEYKTYIQREFFDTGVISAGELVADGHCIAPEYLNHQIDSSRENLGVRVIDLYYLHNPEQQLDALSPTEFQHRVRRAFETLEQRVADGDITSYGCATWQGFRLDSGARGYLSLVDLVTIAQSVAGDGHHFSTVQLPINLAMPEAMRSANQCLPGGRWVPLLEAAAELGISVVASASLLQGKLASALPQQVRDAFPALATDSARALAFVRSLPGVTTALVGMKSTEHVDQNLQAGV